MICEGCIKQDTCKYKDEVAMYEECEEFILEELIEPLEAVVGCKYKQTYPPLPNCSTTTDSYDPSKVGWVTYTA